MKKSKVEKLYDSVDDIFDSFSKLKVKDFTRELGFSSREFRLLKEYINENIDITFGIGTDNFGVFKIDNKDSLKRYLRYNNTLIKSLKQQNRNVSRKARKYKFK
jgi:hypothetical protein